MKIFSQRKLLRKLNVQHALLSFVFMLISCSSHQADVANEVMLFDFQGEFDQKQVSVQDGTYQIIDIDGQKKMKVNSGFTIKEPGVKLLRTEKNYFDLSGYYQIKADVSNLSDKGIQVELFVGNDPDDLIRWFCSDYVDLKPGESKTISVDLAWTPWAHDPQLDIRGLRGIPGKIKTDLSAIDEFTFSTRYASSPSCFTVDNVRAIGRLEMRDTTGFFPFIDEFGQYKHRDWKDKVHSLDELVELEAKEQADLSKNPGPQDRSQYGGWSKGPQLKATGFFRTEKYHGKWWLVDPDGYLFWTAGLNCVTSNSYTGVQAREKYFEKLPPKEGYYKYFYEKSSWASHGFYKDKVPYDAFSFYKLNLYKKYGKEWLDKFREKAHKRIRSWGMNTIGFMSDFGAALQQKTPYVGSIWIQDTPKIDASKGYWGKFHDVFDPEFRKIVKRSVGFQKTGAGDPWCIGYFIDNELSWGLVGSLSVATLESPSIQPAKIEFIKDLKAKYTDIDALNNKWKSYYASWDDMLERTDKPNEELASEDLIAFYEKIADTYFRIINEELKKVAPNQNYLGCRFAWANNDITLKAAAKYLDIVSFNKYEYSVENVRMPEGVDCPIMIGEFHFGALDRGMTHLGVKAAQNQADRGQKYQDYIQGALRNEQIVGAHWFQYLDQPVTGRGDGENYNVGFVTGVDYPYEELIQKVRETCYDMYEYRDTH